jgi:hypothetical protein
MKGRLLLVAIPLLVVASCARGRVEEASRPAASSAPRPAASSAPFPGSARSSVDVMSQEEAERELALAERQLGDALALAAPDCDAARALRDRICELSARICKLAEATADGTVKERCDDGKRRCGLARGTVGERCP